MTRLRSRPSRSRSCWWRLRKLRWCPAGGDPRPLGPRAGTGGPDPAWSTGTGSCPREGREDGVSPGTISQNKQDVPMVVPRCHSRCPHL
ncbi:hypothetical protein Nmel_017826 [Mimus melanotis]